MKKQDGLADLAGWSQDDCDQVPDQRTLDEQADMQVLNPSTETMALQMMANLLEDYRRDLLDQIGAFKALRTQESSLALAHLHMRHRLQLMEDHIISGIQGWKALRDDYSVQRACHLQHPQQGRRLLTSGGNAQEGTGIPPERPKRRKMRLN